jgi:amidohydrolase
MEDAMLADLIALRRDIHRNPEVRFREHRTAKLLGERLSRLGLTVRGGVATTGIVATIDGGRPGPHVLLRADMDALSTTDTKTVDYASASPGVAHVCGHDVHCAVVLGAAQLLIDGDALSGGGRLTVLYQPAEEIPFGEPSGAAAVLESGVFMQAPPDAVLGLHCWPQLPSGTIGLDVQTAMAAKLAFKIAVHGQGAHAATPQLGRDALLGASQIIVALHTLASRERDPGERVALNVGTIQSGTSQSIVASYAELSGTVRTVSDSVARRFKSSIERVASGVAAAYGLTASVDWKNEMPAVINDRRLVQLARKGLAGSPDVAAVTMIENPPMTADDFALYSGLWPGLYMKLGVARPGADGWPSLHDGAFDVDESCISTGAHALAVVAKDILLGGDAILADLAVKTHQSANSGRMA